MLYPVHLPLGIDAPKLATLTHPNDTVWELELHAGAHNTLSTPVITQCLMKALDITEKDWIDTGGLDKGGRPRYHPGAFVIVGPRGDGSKYFSRGLDPGEVRSPGFTHHVLHPFLSRLLSFPMPTVVCMNGHTYAGGFFTALACDFRVMKSDAVASMTELLGGFPVTPYLAALLNVKFRDPATARKTLLEAHRWTASELEELGIVDVVVTPSGPLDSMIVAARRLAENKAGLAMAGAYAVIRRELMREVIQLGQLDSRLVFPEDEVGSLKAKL